MFLIIFQSEKKPEQPSTPPTNNQHQKLPPSTQKKQRNITTPAKVNRNQYVPSTPLSAPTPLHVISNFVNMPIVTSNQLVPQTPIRNLQTPISKTPQQRNNSKENNVFTPKVTRFASPDSLVAQSGPKHTPPV